MGYHFPRGVTISPGGVTKTSGGVTISIGGNTKPLMKMLSLLYKIGGKVLKKHIDLLLHGVTLLTKIA
jgi:hypothetical protein